MVQSFAVSIESIDYDSQSLQGRDNFNRELLRGGGNRNSLGIRNDNAPSFVILHAVDIEYDHHCQQRNQIYGNLWYENVPGVVDSGHTIVDLLHYHKMRSSLLPRRFKSGVSRGLKIVKLINR